MIIFTENNSTRLSYTLNYIFKQCLGLKYSVVNNIDEFISCTEAKINYSKQEIDSSFQILPEGLLFENSVRDSKPDLGMINEMPVIFSQHKSSIPFDLFSSVFWFISRYEEYQEFTEDEYNRFPATESYAFKNHFLERPIVDEWIQYFKEILKQKFPDIEFKNRDFKSKLTIDIDSPWCYKNKGFLRNMVGLLRDISYANLENIKLRLQVLTNKVNDPWYKFDWLLQQSGKAMLDLLFFIHVGDYGKYDKSASYKSKAFKNFVIHLHSKADLGIHPSYKASNKINTFGIEIQRLSDLTNKKITKSRQHFLAFSLPKYYPKLIELGIEDDYSMGFADKPGFRAGTSNSFHFFDLNKNEETNLMIHPFAVMDRTLNSYESQSPEKAIETVKKIIDNVKMVNGTFVSLWHNESLSNHFEWKGWLAVFEEINDYLASLK